MNKLLSSKLDSIYNEDQGHRKMIIDIEKEYGWTSKEMNDLLKIVKKSDSINLIKVTNILDTYGWLGPDIVGEQGNRTLFLIMQHADFDLEIQEKYLPMLRKAVKKGNAKASNLALLEDRVARGRGKKQIYGSQIEKNPLTGKYFVAPIKNEKNVNKRRSKVGLNAIEDYAREWGIEYQVREN